MSEYSEDGYFSLNKKEFLPLLLYILFCDDFKEYHESNDLSLHYKNIMEKVASNSNSSDFLRKAKEGLVSKKVKNFAKVEVDTLEFDRLVHDSMNPPFVYSNSIENLKYDIKEEELQAKISNFKNDKLTREEFKRMVRQEPLWNICRAILYLFGYKGSEDIEENLAYVKSDNELSKVFKYVLSSARIGELSLIELNKGYDIVNYKKDVEPQKFMKWVKKRGIESLFFTDEALQESKKPIKSEYVTPDMQLMFDAIEKFWKEYDLLNPDISKAPFKKDVVKWLVDEAKKRKMDFSKTRAGHMDTIMRCSEARRGGNSF